MLTGLHSSLINRILFIITPAPVAWACKQCRHAGPWAQKEPCTQFNPLLSAPGNPSWFLAGCCASMCVSYTGPCKFGTSPDHPVYRQGNQRPSLICPRSQLGRGGLSTWTQGCPTLKTTLSSPPWGDIQQGLWYISQVLGWAAAVLLEGLLDPLGEGPVF